MNEYMHLVMKKNKIAIKLDENIGIAFFDWDQMSTDKDDASNPLLDGQSVE